MVEGRRMDREGRERVSTKERGRGRLRERGWVEREGETARER